MFKIYIVTYIINRQLYVQNLHIKYIVNRQFYVQNLHSKRKVYDLILYTMSLAIK